MKTLEENKFFKVLSNNKADLKVEIEDRVGLGYRTYGIKNHAEFIEYMNPHDNCLWDAIIPGYDEVINKKSIYKSKKVLGILWLSDGNHKIAIRIGKRGYNKQKAQKDINTYVTNYLKGYYKRKDTNTNPYGKWIQLSDF